MLLSNRKNTLKLSITALGFSAIISQLILIREFICVLNGNELVLGVILANWLFLTGVGSHLGKYFSSYKNKLNLLYFCQIFIALLPILQTLFIRTFPNLFFVRGLSFSFLDAFIISFITLLPFCIISGFMLTITSAIYTDENDTYSIGKIYLFDNLGSIIGGCLFSFFLVNFLEPFDSLYAIGLLNVLICFIFSDHIKRKYLIYINLMILIVLIISYFFINLNIFSLNTQYAQDIVYAKDTQYGKLVITKDENQFNFFSNGIPLFSTLNTVANEETVHYAMLQHKNPKKVLLLFGGVAGTLGEISKYSVEQVDYVELDPIIIKISKQFTNNIFPPNVNIINQDGRLYLSNTDKKYDVIIVDTPEPNTFQINRYYTKEFFQLVKNRLNNDGILSISLSGSPNYMSTETKKLNASIYKTLKSIFYNCIIIPGDKNYVVSSNSDLSYDIKDLIEKRHIENEYVNKYFLDGIINDDRINTILNGLKIETEINTDFKPILYYYHLEYWLSQFNFEVIYVLLFIILVILLFVIFTKPIQLTLFTTGFYASSMEIIMLIIFQILFGYVYYMLSVIITFFMIGLALGVFFINKRIDKMNIKHFKKIQLMLVILSLLMPFFIYLSTLLSIELSNITIPFITSVLAFFVGAEFPIAGKLNNTQVIKVAASLYWADLLGSSLGAIAVTTFLIPLLGIYIVCLILSSLNIISFIFIWKNTRRTLSIN